MGAFDPKSPLRPWIFHRFRNAARTEKDGIRIGKRGKIVRRKLQGALLILSALLGAYSVFAWRSLRGTGAYRINTLWGAALAHTWPYTAAFVLTVVFLLACRVAYALNVRFRRAAPAPETVADGASRSAGKTRESLTEKIPPERGRLTEGGADIPDEERFLSNAILYAALHSPTEDETRCCQQCGAKLEKNYKFCKRCGTPAEGE